MAARRKSFARAISTISPGDCLPRRSVAKVGGSCDESNDNVLGVAKHLFEIKSHCFSQQVA
jgi:hypothetical protein